MPLLYLISLYKLLYLICNTHSIYAVLLYTLFRSSALRVTEVYFPDSIYAGLSLARFSFRLGVRRRSRQEEETDSGMLVSRCTRLLVASAAPYRRNAPGRNNFFYVAAREFPTRRSLAVAEQPSLSAWRRTVRAASTIRGRIRDECERIVHPYAATIPRSFLW